MRSLRGRSQVPPKQNGWSADVGIRLKIGCFESFLMTLMLTFTTVLA